MIISIFVNPCTAAIELVERNDMSGNTDWIRPNLQKAVAEELLSGNIRDDHGAALYKWENGAVWTRTEEERRREWGEEPQEQPTIDQRMTTAEGEIKDLGTALDVILEGRMPE